MTKREFLEAVIAMETETEIHDYAVEALQKMDITNSKRRAKAAEKRAETDEFVNTFVSFLTDEPMTASMIMEKMVAAGVERADEKAVNVQWVSSLGRKAVEAEKAVRHEIKVKGKGTQVGYTK